MGALVDVEHKTAANRFRLRINVEREETIHSLRPPMKWYWNQAACMLAVHSRELEQENVNAGQNNTQRWLRLARFAVFLAMLKVRVVVHVWFRTLRVYQRMS